MNLKELIDTARMNNCSDIHLTAGTAIAYRRFGTLIINRDQIPTLEESEYMILSTLDDETLAKVQAGEDVDFSMTDREGNRIRINVYHQRNNLAASIRLIQSDIPSFKELNLPDVIRTFCEKKSGLVLVSGPTGSGKSTTLASMIDYINKTQSKHVITIEDPIEYFYRFDKAMIHQRQIGKDVKDFATALRSALREDPDVIMVGEMRDFETIMAAITAAETGHLVFSTLHTRSSAQTVERIIGVCPAEYQQTLVSQLSSTLIGVVTQELVPLAKGEGRIVATEVLINNTACANLIKERKIKQIDTVIQSNMLQSGMHTLNYSLAQLVKSGDITIEEACKHTTSTDELQKMLIGF